MLRLRSFLLISPCWALEAIRTNSPDAELFPHVTGHVLQPQHTTVEGPKQTNKFWANWIVSDPVAGNGAMHAIYPMPYVLKLGSNNELKASQNPEAMVWYQDGRLMNRDGSRLELYRTAFVGEFALGATEIGGQHDFKVVKEGIFGIHVELRNPSANVSMRYPIYSGMAYVTASYLGATPKITTERRSFGGVTAFNELTKIRPGIWSVQTGYHQLSRQGAHLRIYVLDANLDFVDESYDLELACESTCLVLNKPLHGWLRAARGDDGTVLDAHARAVLVDWNLEVEDGLVRYKFQLAKSSSPLPQLLHWAYAHHEKMLQHGNLTQMADGLASSQAPTKGRMRGVLGNEWLLRAKYFNETRSMGFLPSAKVPHNRRAKVLAETKGTLEWLRKSWRHAMFKSDFYFSGKGFQKVAMVCLLEEQLLGSRECAGWLARGFECILHRSKHPDVPPDCAGAPAGLFYDQDWGGLPSRVGYKPSWHPNPVLHCMLADFGNSCYNDHHYHFGYFVVSAAVLTKLKPEWKQKEDFLSFVDGLVRDTSNPSDKDHYFPRFRSFDWFDLHSWSRGLAPNPEGKDEESTSEDLNLYFGIQLWGKETKRSSLQELGATMLAMATATVQEFFLMADGNPHHPPDYARNRAPGMLLQNKAHYATYFGNHFEYIHGIQMMPLSPALMLARSPKFNALEWSEILCNLPLSSTDPWTSVLLTGNLASVEPDLAFERLNEMPAEKMDDGLTKAYALYWASVQPHGNETWSCGRPFFHGPQVCPPGQYRSGVQCLKCPAGTWNNLTNQTSHLACRLCEAGRYSSQDGLTSNEACQLCPPDTWSVTAGAQLQDACIPCARDRQAHPSCQTSRPSSPKPSTSTTFLPMTTASQKAVMLVTGPSGTSSGSQPVVHVMMVAALLWSVAGALTSCCHLLTANV